MASVEAPTASSHPITRPGRPENLTPWKPGQSGNPNGRPSGLAKRIREATNEGQDLVDFMSEVFRNEREKTSDRITAATWLADRCWGRPAQAIELRSDEAGTVREQLERMTPEERAELRRRIEQRTLAELTEVEREGQERAEAGERLALPAPADAA